MAQDEIERQFTVSGPAALRVSNIRGRIDIRPGEEGLIQVTAVKGPGGDADRTAIEMEQEADGSVRIKTTFQKRWGWFFDWRSPCPVTYTIRVPRACSVKVRGVSCDTDLEGLQGEFDVKTVSGALRLRGLTGRVRAAGVSGAVYGEGLGGPLDVETVSGDVEMRQSSFPTVVGKSVSGTLLLEVLPGPGPYRFRSVSGRVDLAVPAGRGCAVEMSSVSGRLHTDLPITRTWGQERQRGSDIQGGGPAVSFSTVSGDLRVRQIGAAPEPTPAPVPPPEPAPVPPPPPPPPPPDIPAAPNPRRAILDRIARGEITAAQGVEELKKLQES